MIWFKLALATSVWEEAFQKQPNPGTRDLHNKDYFVVEIADPQSLSSGQNWTLEEPFPISNHWLFSSFKSDHTIHKRDALAFEHGAQSYYKPGVSNLRRRMPLPIPQEATIEEDFMIKDPLFKDQWYLHNKREEGHDMNVAPVWRSNITGHGITVAIVDDGLDYDHPDFKDSFSLEGSWDYNLHQQHPKPVHSDDTHGTRCAGEVAAGINDVCGVGVAFGAKVAGIRILSELISHSDEARALLHRYNVNDIYSCSWGPSDDGMTIDGPPAIVKRAELDGIENGRKGKGSIYVVASGNGDLHGDNCNYDGYTNSIYSITIGAIDRQNRHPYYAESCSANMVVTYSSNYVDKISTTDRLDPLHPKNAKCTDKHTGTSAAAPIAAGIFALVLEQRPDLTWRDLQYLVRDTAKRFDIVPNVAPTLPNRVNHDWVKTADGHLYHNSYGYGLLDAEKIVQRAATWELVKPQAWLILPPIETKQPITPESSLSLEVSQKDWEEANMERIEHVRVRVSWEHETRGSLTFQLESPAGIVSDLAGPRRLDVSNEPVTDWDFLSVVHWNETGPGVWRLRVTGPEGLHGIVSKWQLKLFGEAKDPSKATKFSEVWNRYENPESVVKDAWTMQHTAASSPEEPVATGSMPVDSGASPPPKDPPKKFTTAPHTDIIQSATLSPPEPSSSTQQYPSASPTKSASSESVSSGSRKVSHHSLLFYITISVAGIGLIGLLMLPIVYFGYKKRQSDLAYVHLNVQDFEMDSIDDNFEIDDDEEVESVYNDPHDRS